MAWIERSDDYDSVFYRGYDAASRAWSDPVRLENETGDAKGVTVVLAPEGVAVAWSQMAMDGLPYFRANTLDAATRNWSGAAVIMKTAARPTLSLGAAALGIDASGRVHVGWEIPPVHTPYIVSKKIGDVGWSEPIIPTNLNDGSPTFLRGSSGEALAVIGACTKVLRPGETSWDPVFCAQTIGRIGAAVVQADKVTVALLPSSVDPRDIVVESASISTGAKEAPVVINSDHSSMIKAPMLAPGPGGQVFAIWRQGVDIQRERQWVRRFDGTAWGEVKQLSDLDGAAAIPVHDRLTGLASGVGGTTLASDGPLGVAWRIGQQVFYSELDASTMVFSAPELAFVEAPNMTPVVFSAVRFPIAGHGSAMLVFGNYLLHRLPK